MRVTAEVPAGQTFGHSEGEGNFALFIGTKLWVEEGCFRKVRTQVGGSFGKSFFFGCAVQLACLY